MINTGKSTQGWHRVATFQECPQKFAYEYILELPKESNVKEMQFGTLMHVALANRYGQMLQMVDAQDPIAAIDEAANGNMELANEAKALYFAYDKKWTEKDLVPMAVEKEFQVTINGTLY